MLGNAIRVVLFQIIEKMNVHSGPCVRVYNRQHLIWTLRFSPAWSVYTNFPQRLQAVIYDYRLARKSGCVLLLHLFHMCHPAQCQINNMYYWMAEPHTSLTPCIFRHISTIKHCGLLFKKKKKNITLHVHF